MAWILDDVQDAIRYGAALQWGHAVIGVDTIRRLGVQPGRWFRFNGATP